MSIKITSANNTLVPCYLEILSRGYSIRVSKGENADDWIATRGDTSLHAEDPITLLGLVSMIESRGSNWKAEDEDIDDFLEWYDSAVPVDTSK